MKESACKVCNNEDNYDKCKTCGIYYLSRDNFSLSLDKANCKGVVIDDRPDNKITSEINCGHDWEHVDGGWGMDKKWCKSCGAYKSFMSSSDIKSGLIKLIIKTRYPKTVDNTTP